MESEDSDFDDLLDNLLANGGETEKLESSSKSTETQESSVKKNFLQSPNTIESPKVPAAQNKSLQNVEKLPGDEKQIDDSWKNSNSSPTSIRSSETALEPNDKAAHLESWKDFNFSSKKVGAAKAAGNLGKKSNLPPRTMTGSCGALEKGNIERKPNSHEWSKNCTKILKEEKARDVPKDPVFGFRIAKPLVSSSDLTERMGGRTPVPISRIKSYLSSTNGQGDWVVAGVIIKTNSTQTSQNGNKYSMWRLSDLSEGLLSVTVFLYDQAYKTFWKTAAGMVVGILNPAVLQGRDNGGEASLSVNNDKKIMLLGLSWDMGKCKSTTLSGDPCSNIVNRSQCEYCVYHVKKEYGKAMKRSDIRSTTSTGLNPFSGGKDTRRKQNPTAGMYSQQLGENFVPRVAKRNPKLYEKDAARLALLRGSSSASDQQKSVVEELPKPTSGSSPLTRGSTLVANAVKSMNRENCLEASKKQMNGLSLAKLSPMSGGKTIPRLSMGNSEGKIDLSEPITRRHIESARTNARRWIEENGKIGKSNPNKVRESRDKILNAGKKRSRESEEAVINEENRKKASLSFGKFKEMLETKSAHVDLIEQSRENDKDKHLEKLEIKERMEEKMMSTYKVQCKAVKCSICKYTAFSGSDMCKKLNHPLTVIDAMKSFFKCNDCGNRTVSLDRIPAISCQKCRGSRWVRTSMMAEARTDLPAIPLSVRGGEEKFIGSVANDTNINLCIPDSGT